MKVYLAGLITGAVLDKCVEWRKQIRNHYDNWKGEGKYPIVWLDPLNSGELDNITPDGLASNISAGMIVAKDMLSVRNSDIVVANLDRFGHDRPLTGTLIELGWAHIEHKPIIVITKDDYYKNHPFIKIMSADVVSSVEELLEKKLINKFYKSLVSAEY